MDNKDSKSMPELECTASIISVPEQTEMAFFEIEIESETEDVFYSLKREFADGRFETVQTIKISSIIPDDNEMPNFYSFEDENIPNEDFTYMLMRIAPKSNSFNVLQRWDYCSVSHSLCSNGILASK